MGEWTFEVLGPPLPWMRARSNGKRRFTPPEQAAYQRKVKLSAQVAGVPMLSGPVVLDVVAYVAHRAEAHLTGSGDIDNALKQAMDSLQGLAFRDDAQVTDATCRKRVDKTRPRLEVTVTGTPAVRTGAESRTVVRFTPNYRAPGKLA